MEFVVENEALQDDAALLELLAADAQPFYEPRLPYHNWDEHIQGGLRIIDDLCDQDQQDGKPINRLMAQVAYMFHDAGYPHDLITPGIWEPYESKEGYSAHIAETILRSYKVDEDFIAGVRMCIMFTKMEYQLPEDVSEELKNTAEAVRTADLSNVFGPYKGFVVNSFKLMEESQVYGRDPNLKKFKEVSRFVLTNFLGLGFIPKGTCRTVDAMKNIDRFTKDSPSRLRQVLGDYATRFADLLKKDAA